MSSGIKYGNLARGIQLFIVDLVLTVAGVLALARGVWLGYHDNSTVAVTCIGAGLVLLFAATIQRFELLKGWGIEAKVKHLDATIDQAQKALDGLQELTEVSTEALIFLSSSAGSHKGPPSLRRAQDLSKQVKRILALVGSTPDVISRVLEPWILAESQQLAMRSMLSFRNRAAEKIAEIRGDAQKEGVTPPVSDSLNLRAENLRKHADLVYNIIQLSDASEICPAAIKLIQDCPELLASERDDFISEMQPYHAEIRYLIKNGDFNDISFWTRSLENRR